jgi:hypothetical protein
MLPQHMHCKHAACSVCSCSNHKYAGHLRGRQFCVAQDSTRAMDPTSSRRRRPSGRRPSLLPTWPCLCKYTPHFTLACLIRIPDLHTTEHQMSARPQKAACLVCAQRPLLLRLRRLRLVRSHSPSLHGCSGLPCCCYHRRHNPALNTHVCAPWQVRLRLARPELPCLGISISCGHPSPSSIYQPVEDAA